MKADKDLKKIFNNKLKLKQKRSKLFYKVSLASVKTICRLFIGLFVFSYNGGSIAHLIRDLNQNGETAAEVYGREKREERSTNKFNPMQTEGIRSNYTDNILYTKNFLELKNENSTQEEWIRDLNRFLSKEMILEEDDIVKFIATESSLISRLKEEREMINPDSLKNQFI